MVDGPRIRPSTILLIVLSGVLPQLGNQLGQDLGWNFNLPLAGAGLVAGIWAGLRTRHAQQLIRRGLPVLTVLYVALLIVLAASQTLPLVWFIVVPTAIWSSALVLVVGQPWHASRPPSANTGVMGLAAIGFGVAGIGAGVALLFN